MSFKRLHVSSIILMLLQGTQVHKAVFMVFFQGETLKAKIKKICEG